MAADRHKTKRLANVLAVLVSALFAAIGIAGFQRTDDLALLGAFLALSLLSYLVVIFIFKGIDKLLDTVDDRKDNS